MRHRLPAIPLALVVVLSTGLCASVLAEEKPLPSQTSIAEIVTLTGEVVAVDTESRYVTLRGPLGGEITGRVADDVKNLAQVKAGDLVTIAYYQSMALSAAKKGEPNPLFTGGDAATAAPGEKPAGYVAQQTKRTVTVAAVDPEQRSVVFRGEDGTLFPVEVERPEFARKLETLRVGDQLDVVVTEAVIAEVKPAAPGAKPSITHETGTLIVDRGEVIRRVGHTLFIRTEQGRMIRAAVDPKFKFLIDGKEATVEDLKPGTKLTRTALRVTEAEYSEGE
jgi:hypothetical protein